MGCDTVFFNGVGINVDTENVSDELSDDLCSVYDKILSEITDWNCEDELFIPNGKAHRGDHTCWFDGLYTIVSNLLTIKGIRINGTIPYMEAWGDAAYGLLHINGSSEINDVILTNIRSCFGDVTETIYKIGENGFVKHSEKRLLKIKEY